MLSKEEDIYVAYSDESNYNNSRYCSISMISLRLKDFEELGNRINECLNSSGINEFKWNQTGTARSKFCAIKIIDVVFDFAKQGKIRIDTIIWDSNKRKDFKREKDTKILGKMYYHLYDNVLRKRWPKGKWKLYPHKQGAIDWKEFQNILENVSSRLRTIKTNNGSIKLDTKKDYNVLEIYETDSKESCLCQIADLFSGLAAFYHLKCPTCNLSPQQQGLTSSFKRLSNKDVQRYEIIRHIIQKSKKSSMDIIFDSLTGVRTTNPDHPINFWQFKIKRGRHDNQRINKFF